jgi:hypothetical protein
MYEDSGSHRAGRFDVFSTFLLSADAPVMQDKDA